MIKLLSDAGYTIYTEMAKPLLFRIKADTVHEAMVGSGDVLQRIPFAIDAMRGALRYDDTILEQTLIGISFKTPLGLSAGLDKDARLVRVMEAVGFGFAECGSVTFGAYEGNPKPWFTRLPKSQSIVVNSGLRSQGASAVAQRVCSQYDRQFLQQFPLNISIAKTNTQENCDTAAAVVDYCESLKIFENTTSTAMYTLNISCPNTYGGEPFTTPELLAELLDGVSCLGIKKPVFLKLPIDKSWVHIDRLLKVASRYALVKGITLGNLYKDRDTVKLQDPLPEVPGNFSGKPCWDKSNELLAASYHSYKDRFVFSGVGGVFSAEDAYQKIRLGASLVQLVTGLIFQGPSAPGRINAGLAELLRRDGFDSVSDAVGVDTIATKKGKTS